MESVLLGMLSQIAEQDDTTIIDDLRSMTKQTTQCSLH